jgi:GNAT superfamily N-acetyltransferase
MGAGSVSVRPIGVGEWPVYRNLRLASLLDAPDAFGQLHGEEADADDDAWERFVARSAAEGWQLLVAEMEGKPVGIASCGVGEGGASLWIGGMWVRPSVRRRGVGRTLVEAAIEWGRARNLHHARLAVTRANGPAERLYEGAGFSPSGETGTLRAGSAVEIVWLEREL